VSRARAQALKERGVSTREIAERLGVSASTVGAWLRRPPTFPQRTCRLCRQPFTPTNGRQRFCSLEHYDEYQRQHRAPQTLAGWHARVQQLEAEIAQARAQLNEHEAA
jgi:transposase